MSRSRRAARGDSASAPRTGGTWLRAPEGGVRAGWLLAVSLLCGALAAAGLRLALGAGLAALFRGWGVNADTVARAPAWARLLYRWQGSLVSVAVAAALLALSAWLRRLWLGVGDRPRIDGRGLARYALAGLALALAALLLGLIPDSVRPEWPLGAPRLSWSLPALCAVSLLTALAEEAFTKRVLFDGIRSRAGAAWAAGVACAAFFLKNGGAQGNVVSAVNVLLLGALGCALYARRGLWAAVGLRWGWSAATVFLLGFGGGDAAVYRFYGVSENLLTGGDAGPAYGLWTTALLAAWLGWLLWRTRKRHPKAGR